ncbi:glycosyltransferase [Rhizobium sp. AQ_MP]|uniref:glycosyltransferase n=1 Tax=Rhizobium sp. AQ_MP TaxID=2761536 RepID=UPI00163960EB|nr:glycosyltransferase [Rhizobium sp. AQ_MP]MBC2775887.1 glycosyltransferase [Rhizobium sp. AQ_MP]
MTKRPLRFALLLNNFNGGGGERAHVMLANGLAEIGHDVEMIVVNSSGPCKNLLSSKVRITDLGARRAVLAAPALVRALRKSAPDVLISAMVIANVLAALAGLVLRNLPMVAIEHGDMNETYQSDKRKLAALLGYRLAPHLYGRFARIYCVDASSLISVAAFTRRSDLPLSVMPNAVIGADADARMAAPTKHHFFDEALPVLVNVGRLSDQKNQALLLEAFAEVTKKTPARLIVLGEGPLRQTLEAKRDELGLQDSVDLPGFVDPFPYLARAAGFILSSKWEALPTVVIEALYCGCRVVVTKASMGTLELVGYGRFGRIAREPTVPILASEIEAILSDNTDRSALRRQGARYGFQAVANQYADDVCKILSKTEGSAT